MRIRACLLILLGPLVALPGCNSGLAGLVAAATDSDGSAMVPTTVSDVTVRDSKNSPAEIGFTLAGETAETVHIEYRPASPGPRGNAGYVPIATLGAGDLNISPSGAANRFDWAFAGDLGTGFVDGLAVRVRLAGGASATTGGSISVGNSPPVISPFSFPSTEIVGVVGMLFTVADTSDTVSLTVEVNADAENDFPDGAWETALPDLGEVLVPFVAVETGTTVSFHWDVVGQYGPLDSEVKVRATAVDTADPGEQPLQHQVEASSLLRVDNNAPPVVSLDAASFLLSDDQRRGIVVPYTVSDAEGDTPDLVFQWTREGEPFVDLPDDEALVEEILGDPALREEFRIATRSPRPTGGLARSTGEADTVELPDLGSSQSHLLQYAEQPGGDLGGALDGYELELLRSSKIPVPLAGTWLANPLDGPVAVLPTAEPTTAYVLDRAAGSMGMGWQVREIDLATGAVRTELANGVGEPDTMTMERGGAALLVAAHDLDVRVCRVDLDTLEVLAILDAPGPLPGDAIRGLASVGSGMVLATVGDELLRVSYADPFAPPSETRIATVLSGLATPWGMVVEPVNRNRVYLAERDFAGVGRVLSVDLDTLSLEPLLTASPGLPHPESLALARGNRLLVLTDETPADGTKELRALDLDSGLVDRLTTELPESATGLAVGPDDLRLLALVSGHDVAAGGGVVQRRTIVGYDPIGRVATVDAAFAPPILDGLASGLLWRVQAPARLRLEAGVPRSAAFVWDSRDLPGGQGRALLRLTARDADASLVEHDGGRQILSGLGGEPLSLGGPGTTDESRSATTADLDGDGDLDLVSANTISSTVTVFFQTAAGVFDPVPSLTLGGPGTTDGAADVAAADLDGDGDLDLVSANGEGSSSAHTVTVFFQTAPGVFDPAPSLTLGGPGTTDFAKGVSAADLDGDGDIDIASANAGSASVTVFFQTGAGVFDPVPSHTLSVLPGSPQFVETADVDGDGDIDIVSGAFATSLQVFFQTGAGVFDPMPSVTVLAFGSLSAAVADLDGDGDVDLVTPSIVDGTLQVFFQTAPGVFDPVPSLTLGDPVSSSGPLNVTAADVDGDGDVDIVSANILGDTLTVFSQRSPGVFDPLPTLTLGGPQVTDGAADVAVADLDGDGHADIISSNVFSNTLAVFFQTGAGVFDPVPSQTLGSVSASGFPGGVAAADLDGDGDLDLVSASLGLGNTTRSSLAVFFQTGAGVFDPVPSLNLGAPGEFHGAVSVAAADLDGDGDVDLVSANGYDVTVLSSPPGTDTLTVFFQTEAGVFEPTPSLTLGGPETTDGAVSVAAADLDGDGDVDLVSANEFSSTLTVFFQTEAGVFDPVPSLTLGGPQATRSAKSVAVADLDGDGDADLVSANDSGNTLTVFFQTEAGVFDPVPSLTLGSPQTTAGPFDVDAVDWDGDGDVDLVSANAVAGTLTVFLQTGAGVFDPVPSLTVDGPPGADSPESVRAADLDGDGDTDLVSADPLSRTLTVFLQTRAGIFESASFPLGGLATALSEAAVDLAVVDLDGDGDADIVSANGVTATLSVFYGSHEP